MTEAQLIYNEGDQVRHKTGGPVMIYTGQDDLKRCICTWMDGGRKQSDTFHPSEIKKVEEPDGGSFVGIRAI